MDAKEVRRENLRALIQQYGRSRLAARVATDPNYLTQILSEKSSAQLGDSLARRIEVELGRPRGWMDQDHSRDDALEEELTSAIELVIATAEEEGRTLTARQIARIVSVLRDRHSADPPTHEQMLIYLDLVT